MSLIPPSTASIPAWTALRSREEFAGSAEHVLLTVKSASGVGVRDTSGGRAPSEDLSGYRIVRSGDLVVNKLWARFGAYGVSQLDGIISPAYWVLRIAPEAFHPRFLHHVLRSPLFQAEIGRISRNLPPNGFDLSWEQFRRLPLPRLPLDDQRRIADFLDHQVGLIDRAIGLRQDQKRLAEERFRAQLSGLYETGGVGRTRARLQDLLKQPPCYGVLVPSLQDTGIPFIRVNDLPLVDRGEAARAYITAEQSHEYRRTIVETGDVLTSVVGTLGSAAIVRPDQAGSNVARAVCRLQPRNDVPAWLIRGWLSTPQFLTQAELATGAGTAQPTLNMGDLRKFTVGMADDGDLDACAARAKELFRHRERVVGLMDSSAELMQERKQALVTAAVTGQFDVATARSVA